MHQLSNKQLRIIDSEFNNQVQFATRLWIYLSMIFHGCYDSSSGLFEFIVIHFNPLYFFGDEKTNTSKPKRNLICFITNSML